MKFKSLAQKCVISEVYDGVIFIQCDMRTQNKPTLKLIVSIKIKKKIILEVVKC